MKILKSSIWSVFSVALRTLIIFIVNKLFAANYGPQGITLLAHFQNLLSIFLTVSNDGVNKGVIKYTADASLEEKNYYPILNAGLFLNLLIFIFCLVAIVIFKDYFENPFIGTNNVWLTIVFVLALFQLLNLLGLSIILAKEKLKPFIILQLSGNFLSLIATWIAVEMASFQEALLAWASGPAISMIFTFIYLSKKEKLDFKSFLIIPSVTYIRKLSDFIIMALSIVIFSKSVDFLIRQYAISNFSTKETGYWQSVVRISDLYLMAFVAILSMVYYPRVSTIINDQKALYSFVRDFFWKTALLASIFLLSIYFFRDYVMILFFNKGFVGAAYLFPYQLLGDFFKMTSWVLSFLILAQSRMKLFVGTQVVFAILYLCLIYFLINILGIEGFIVAYSLKQGIYLLFTLWIFRKIFF